MNSPMRLTLAAGSLLALATLVAADDADKMQGTWKVAYARVSGTTADAGTRAKLGVIIDGDKFTLIEPGMKESVHFTLDPKASPPHIDFWKGKTASSKGQHFWHGIYEFEGDTLKVCWGPVGAPRPKDFTGGAAKMQRNFKLTK